MYSACFSRWLGYVQLANPLGQHNRHFGRFCDEGNCPIVARTWLFITVLWVVSGVSTAKPWRVGVFVQLQGGRQDV